MSVRGWFLTVNLLLPRLDAWYLLKKVCGRKFARITFTFSSKFIYHFLSMTVCNTNFRTFGRNEMKTFPGIGIPTNAMNVQQRLVGFLLSGNLNRNLAEVFSA